MVSEQMLYVGECFKNYWTHDMLQAKGFRSPKFLGYGTFGYVLKASRCSDSSEVAVKHILTDDDDKESGENVKKEIKTLESVQGCRFIIKYHKHIEVPDSLYPLLRHNFLIMELCAQGSLRDVLNQEWRENGEGGNFSRDEAHRTAISREKIVNWVFHIAQALKFVHQKNIMHRDLKPDNILLNRHSIAKLGDFGSGRLLTGDDEFCATIATTWNYAAPEIYGAYKGENGERIATYTKSADMWALGATLLELLTTFNTPFRPDEGAWSLNHGEYFATKLVNTNGRSSYSFIRAEPKNNQKLVLSGICNPSGLFEIAFKLLELNQGFRLKAGALVAELDSEDKRDKIVKSSTNRDTVYQTQHYDKYGSYTEKVWFHSGSAGRSVRLKKFLHHQDAVRDEEIFYYRDLWADKQVNARARQRPGRRLIVAQGNLPVGFRRPAVPRQREGARPPFLFYPIPEDESRKNIPRVQHPVLTPSVRGTPEETCPCLPRINLKGWGIC